jgi:polygalacturonase
VTGILDRIRPPVFPSQEFYITRYGATGDNQKDCTEAFNKAIAACHAKGGGKVVVPAGEFITGAIHLRSNVNLHIAEGATVRFSRDARKYPQVMTRWEGVELMNYSPFIYAYRQKNIAITGKGTVDGNSDCDHWWPWKGRTDCGWTTGQPEQTNDRNNLFAMAEHGVPISQRVFGEGHFLRPMFIQPYGCQNVLIEDVTLLNSPMWQVHPVLCSNVTVQRLNIRSSGPNTDGCDPESCSDVLIRDCSFDTGDDCIAIKSGRNADGRRLHAPSENIFIQNCQMTRGHGAVTIGSEISGDVRNVFAENCRIGGPQLDSAFRIKNNAMRGGLLKDIFVRNFAVDQLASAAVAIDFFYEEGENGPLRPVVRDVLIDKLVVHKASYALYLRGFKDAPIRDVSLSNCDFSGVTNPNRIENVQNIRLQNVRINGRSVERVASGPPGR